MSEIRRVAVKMKDINSIVEACETAGLEVVDNKNKDRIVVKNHGIHTWGNRDIVIIKQTDGSYVIEGDCNQKDLEKLIAKIKAYYGEKTAIKTLKAKGYGVMNREVNKAENKIRVKLRTFV